MTVARFIDNRRALTWIGVGLVVVTAFVLLARRFATDPVELRAGYEAFIPFLMADRAGRPKGLAVEVFTEAATSIPRCGRGRSTSFQC